MHSFASGTYIPTDPRLHIIMIQSRMHRSIETGSSIPELIPGTVSNVCDRVLENVWFRPTLLPGPFSF